MLFEWNADTIRWYLDADAYTGFFGKLAAAVAPALKGCQTLCDFGCGLGLFDFKIAPLLKAVECVDVNEAALESIRDRAARQGLSNIVTRLGDGFQHAGAWDAAYMSFFGSRELDRFLPQCKKLIAVVSANAGPELFPMKQQRYQRNTADNTEKYLIEKSIPYKLTPMQLEFGQPFVSLNDARRCVRHYVPELTDHETEDFLNSRLKNTHGEVWPYYLPRSKAIVIFELDGALR